MTREEAIAELKAQEEHIRGMSIMGRAAYHVAIEALKQPEQKRGKWLNRYRAKWDRTLYWFRACSECDFERDDCNSEKDTMYCPNCGAKMEKEE